MNHTTRTPNATQSAHAVLNKQHLHATSQAYAGDISPRQAYDWWQAGQAVLVDVRTDAERTWVGQVPGAWVLAWSQWPGMAANPGFEEALQALLAQEGVGLDKRLLFLCRSGARSAMAAKCASALGLEAYNVVDGFEGPPNVQGQRNQIAGWRFEGLPWRQG